VKYDYVSTSGGFTLIEFMVVIAIVGVLAGSLSAKVTDLVRKAQIAAVAQDYRTFILALRLYKETNRTYPIDTDGTMPPGLDTFIRKGRWEDAHPLGGGWNWEGPDYYGFAALSIYPAPDLKTMERLDKIMDDGDIFTGNMLYKHMGTVWRLTYILDHNPT
jgi:prepilin-type N-terminal cleavage/methylation domain-containing protein